MSARPTSAGQGRARPRQRASVVSSCSLALSLATTLLALGCNQATEPIGEPVPETDTTEANLGAIRGLIGTFIHAMNEEDPDELASLFTEDAVRLPPNAEPITGRAAIRADVADLFYDNAVEVSVQLEEARFSGDMGVARGTWSLKLRPEDGSGQSEDVGKWLNLVERQADGSWLISRNIWNSSRPLPTP